MTATAGGPIRSDPRTASRPRILVADPIAENGIDELRTFGDVDIDVGLAPEDLCRAIPAYDALVVRSETKVTSEVLNLASRLTVIGRAGVGVDNIDVEAATKRGVLVLNSPSGNTVAAAEHAMALMLSLMRKIPWAHQSMQSGRWDRKEFSGHELRHRTLGIIGFGKIGAEISHMASRGFGMRVLGYDPLVTPARMEQSGAEPATMERILRESDVVTVHVPVTKETRGMIGAREIALMKPDARILNVARGGIVDETALIAALNEGRLGGAALDVFETEPLLADSPLRAVDNLLLTPHLGASTEEAQVNVAVDVAKQIGEYLAGRMPAFPVNAPSIRPEELEQIGPLLDLAQRMGSLLAQLLHPPIEALDVRYPDTVGRNVAGYVTAELMSGFLRHFTDGPVNVINALSTARSSGISVTEGVSTTSDGPADLIQVEARGGDTVRIGGSLIGDSPRITRLDEFRVDMHPEGVFLVVRHEDRPGVIAGISSALAHRDINIARIDLGRDRPRGHAALLMQIDDQISPEVLEQIRSVTGLESLRLVELE